MPATATGRGGQLLLDGSAQAAARGAVGASLRANTDAKLLLELAGLVGDGNSPDGSSSTGLAAEDIVLSGPFGTISDINILAIAGADNTGASDQSAVIVAAMVAAALFSPPRAVFFPPGTYRIDARITIPADGLRLYAQPGTVTLISGETNPGSGGLLLGTSSLGADGFSCYGITFDGNAANLTTHANMVQIGGPSDSVVFERCTFQNCLGQAILFTGGTLSANPTLASSAESGDTVLHCVASSVPSWIVAGTPCFGVGIPRGAKVQSVAGNDVTLDRALTNAASTGFGVASVTFTPTKLAQFTSPGGSSTLFFTSTSTAPAIHVGDVISHLSIPQGTRVTAVRSAQVDIDKPLYADIAANQPVSYTAGISNSVVMNCVFRNIGQFGLTSGTIDMTINADVALGGQVLHVASTTGLWVGSKTTGTLPTGVPANDIVRVVGATQFTLTTALTAALPSGSTVTFTTFGPLTDCSTALSFLNGAPFANYGNVVEGCDFYGIGGDCIDISFQSKATIRHCRAFLALAGWRPVAAGNAGLGQGFGYVTRCAGVTVLQNEIEGTTGNGLDVNTSFDVSVIGNVMRRTGGAGISFGATDGGVIFGNRLSDIWQSASWQALKNTTHEAGIVLGPTGSGTVGLVSNLYVGGNSIIDTQATPTCPMGIALLGDCVLENVYIDQNNVMSGMTLADYSTAGGVGGTYLACGTGGAKEGFYGTTPIAKPTGVAVSSAGIHAALVSLGLIAA